MTSDRIQLAETLFEAVLHAAPDHRAAILDERCGSDAELRHLVEAMIRGEEQGMGSFLETGPGRRMMESAAAQPAQALPPRIGRYSILRKIGEGGMGVVYEARQSNPQRIVALKVIRPGCVSTALLKRFQHEADVLGQLQHPGIAHIYDAGTLDADGAQPYFAMELIRGVPLNDYAATHALTVAQKLELLARICDAVQHAHQKGVVHRDLKPGNILVIDPDEAGGTDATSIRSGSATAAPADSSLQRFAALPKILDFGIARVIGSDIRTVTVQTDVGQIVGTIPYMSPEQVTGDPAAIDTRSDVYALGVILFELLSGRLPHLLRQAALADAARIIREEEPPRLASLDRNLRGDIDTIVAKALEKEKDRRYGSAAELAADIRRFLRDEPITARPASAVYQLRKFARRNRALVGGVIATIVALAIGLVGTIRYALLESRQRNAAVAALAAAQEARDAESAQRATAQKARDEAQAEARKARTVTTFLQDMLKTADPDVSKGAQLSVLDMLDQAAERVGTDAKEDPDVEASLRGTIGATYHRLGRTAEGEKQLIAAADLLRRKYPDGHPELVRALISCGEAYLEGFNPKAEAVLIEARDICDKLVPRDEAAYARVLYGLATLADNKGNLEESERLYRRALAIRERVLKPDNPEIAFNLNGLAYTLTNMGRSDEAEKLYLDALERFRKINGSRSIAAISCMSNLASLAQNREREEEVVRWLDEALSHSVPMLGIGHPLTSNLNYQKIESLIRQKRFAEAESLGLKVLELRRREQSIDPTTIATTTAALAFIEQQLGKLGQAEAFQREALALRQKALGDGATFTAYSYYRLGDILLERGRFEEAELNALKALPLCEAAFGKENPINQRIRELILKLYAKWNKPGKAAEWQARFAPPATAPASQPG